MHYKNWAADLQLYLYIKRKLLVIIDFIILKVNNLLFKKFVVNFVSSYELLSILQSLPFFL